MKKRNLILLIVVVIITALTCCLTACAKNNDELTKEKEKFYSSWMSAVKDDTPINKVAILGSHDSGTYKMESIIKNMTSTQGLSIGRQLAYGTRYFDIRVYKEGSDLKIFHGPDTSGPNFSDIADDILKFIKANTSEFLILDFQHFGNNSQLAVLEMLESKGLLNYAVKNTTDKKDIDFIDSLTVKDVRGKIIIVWGSNEANDSANNFLFRRNNDKCTMENTSLDSLYLEDENKKVSDKFIAQALPKYMEHIINKNKGLFVLQGQLTSPSGAGDLKALEDSHNTNMSKFIREIKSNVKYLKHINIIMRDFIGSDLEKTNCVLNLNIEKNIIKDNEINNYKKMIK